MYTNGAITLFNKIDGEEVTYQATVINNVYIEHRKQVRQQTIGNDTSNGVYVAIPFNQIMTTDNRTYVASKIFNSADNEDKIKYWTLQDGDFFVSGVIAPPITPYNFDTMMTIYENCYRVSNIKDYRLGITTLQHIVVEGA